MEFLYETHMHSSEVSACATKTAVWQVHSFKEKGYTGVIFTDHFINGYTRCPNYLPWDEKMRFTVQGYEKAKIEGDKCGLDVFFGWEYTIRGSDFLTYGLDIDFLLAHPDLDRLSIEEYSAVVRQNGGFLAQAHPYKDDFYIDYKYPVDHRLIDAVEVYNSNIPDKTNKKAFIFARKYNLPMLAGTDCHGKPGQFNSGIKLAERANNIFDIIKAIKTHNVELVLPEGWTV